ncbi:MAG: GHMP kinase [Rhodobacteraceae bacterium]|nr:GHMP kinase [Paracoccaceae bacterium]
MTTNVTTLTPAGNIARAHAPGKLILSGEHAVIYGAPALAVAVRRYAEVWFRPVRISAGLSTVFRDISQGEFYPLKLLSGFKRSLDRRFEQFLKGRLPVHKILQRPDDLAVYTLVSLMQHSPVPGVGAIGARPAPGQLGSTSALPVGAGMGSSSATIAATFVLFENLLELPQTERERFERVRACDRLQHGKVGAIDAAAVVYGGLVRAQGDAVAHPAIEPHHGLLTGCGWYWVLHGLPDATTGECVSTVRAAHGNDAGLWQGFSDCTTALQAALVCGADVSDILRENHALLVKIGVVPDATQAFIARVKAAGGAAKICGAGSVRGERGGMVLVHQPDADAMAALMADSPGLRWAPLQVARCGAAWGPAPRPAP